MSLEKPSLSGSPATGTNQTDPATILSDFWQEEEEDWATELLRAVNPSGQPSPDSEETPTTPPDKPRDITQIIEFKVPVSNEIQPQGSINVENLWTSNFSSEPSTSLQIVETRVPPSLPAEHLVILPQPPDQEQAGHSSPPHPPGRQFLATPSCQSEEEDRTPTRRARKRGRPMKESPSTTPHDMTRIQSNVSTASNSGSEFSHLSDSTDLTDEEVSALKYRRMRDLNNEASRRCRNKRRVSQENLALELEQQKNKNLLLNEKCHNMEMRIRKLKKFILKNFKNPQQEIALAHQRRIFGSGSVLSVNSESIGIFSDPRDLPEIDCSWLS